MLSLESLRQRFSAAIDDRDMVILLADLLKENSAFVLAHPKTCLNFFRYLLFRWYVHQRKSGYSVAAILGHKDFFGLSFHVSRHTLIPRPETELLVEETLKIVSDQSILIDVGTGTGCIPIAVLKNNHAQIQVWATDQSRQALTVAKKNAKKHRLRIKFFRGNLLTPLPAAIFLGPTPLVITANLPYLTDEQFTNEPSIQHEPYQALVAQKNGLALYEELFKQLQQKKVSFPTTKVAPSKQPFAPTTVLCEIDPSQPGRLIKIIQNYFPNVKTTIKKDLAGRDRLIVAIINP